MLKIQSICKEKRITLQEVSKRLGISYQSLYTSINGNPTLNMLRRIAKVLDVRVVDLFEEEEGGDDYKIYIEHNGEKRLISKEDLKSLFNQKE
ncbi:MAG: DNA-binding helix-turn-helix protein [Bacteroidetes bacterium]|nr:DNA-binding helix-turn-helix protein [Bacteroidota bacterium]